MLEKIDLSKAIDKKEYKKELKVLENRLAALQESMKEFGIPVIVVFEGWSASGKGTSIAKLLYPMDPRNFNVYTMAKVNEDAAMRPVLWSYGTKTPAKGRMTIFDKSWHRAAFSTGESKWKLSDKVKKGFSYDVNAFERQLSDDGMLIIKFFLHIDKEEQKKRFKELEKKTDTQWRINKEDWQQNKEYDKNLKMFEDMIESTDTEHSRWTIVEANDNKYATIKIFKTIINKLEEEIELYKVNTLTCSGPSTIIPPEISILSSIDLSKTITDEEYNRKLNFLQDKMADLGFKLYAKRRSVIIVYEGWDAAGKGGNIKRLTEELDPRGYEVVPIAAPSKDDLSHHYLWRFWQKIPKDGHISIFDRSWYGRVMVERVEGFCSASRWQQAYKEINDMELHLSNHGTIIFKFWLDIDKEEQLKRFTARQNDPMKQHKITDEDWRNREKWDQYETAINEMLFRTSTKYAPWQIIESNCKKYARIKVLEHVTSVLEKELESI